MSQSLVIALFFLGFTSKCYEVCLQTVIILLLQIYLSDNGRFIVNVGNIEGHAFWELQPK